MPFRNWAISDATYDPGPGVHLAQSSHQCTLGELTLGQKHIATVSPLPLGLKLGDNELVRGTK